MSTFPFNIRNISYLELGHDDSIRTPGSLPQKQQPKFGMALYHPAVAWWRDQKSSSKSSSDFSVGFARKQNYQLEDDCDKNRAAWVGGKPNHQHTFRLRSMHSQPVIEILTSILLLLPLKVFLKFSIPLVETFTILATFHYTS